MNCDASLSQYQLHFLLGVFLATYCVVFYVNQQQVLLAFCLILNSLITIGCLFLPRVYAVMCVDEEALRIMAVNTKVTSLESEMKNISDDIKKKTDPVNQHS